MIDIVKEFEQCNNNGDFSQIGVIISDYLFENDNNCESYQIVINQYCFYKKYDDALVFIENNINNFGVEELSLLIIESKIAEISKNESYLKRIYKKLWDNYNQEFALLKLSILLMGIGENREAHIYLDKLIELKSKNIPYYTALYLKISLLIKDGADEKVLRDICKKAILEYENENDPMLKSCCDSYLVECKKTIDRIVSII